MTIQPPSDPFILQTKLNRPGVTKDLVIRPRLLKVLNDGLEGALTLVIAPAGFMQAAVSENVLAGSPMRRRAQFQFGNTLAPGARSHVDAGLGKGIGRGTVTLIPPTRSITQMIERDTIDPGTRSAACVHGLLRHTGDTPAARLHFIGKFAEHPPVAAWGIQHRCQRDGRGPARHRDRPLRGNFFGLQRSSTTQ